MDHDRRVKIHSHLGDERQSTPEVQHQYGIEHSSNFSCKMQKKIIASYLFCFELPHKAHADTHTRSHTDNQQLPKIYSDIATPPTTKSIVPLIFDVDAHEACMAQKGVCDSHTQYNFAYLYIVYTANSRRRTE